ncbi:cytochrome P450 [Cyathus striatus]|nr:cytochrome P450 [Cyathus striatus]
MAYGDTICFYLGRTPSIVLNSVKTATDLLEKRGSIYSSRPRNIIGSEIYSGGMRGVGMQYGQRWRNWRSLMHAGMSIEASNTYKTLQDIESRILLREILGCKDSTEYYNSIRRYVASIVFCVSYGSRISTLEDEVIRKTQNVEQYFIRQHPTSGQFLVESWPILLYLPHSLQWFRWEPERRKTEDTKFYLELMKNVKENIYNGTAHPCTATRALDKQTDFGLNDVETAYALTSPSQAGVGTTLAAFRVFLLAMLNFPETMKKAQAEIDAIIDSNRIPGFEDQITLPYTWALLKETFRWRTIAPFGVPHSVTENDAYKGMFIPKGSTVYANIYAMTQDEEMFPEPDVFRPERFINTDDPRLVNYTISFGFGRRICPGMHIAHQSLFILITRILWAFDVLPVKDNKGHPVVPPTDQFTTGLVSEPKPFRYELVVRRSERVPLILQEAERAEDEALGWM